MSPVPPGVALRDLRFPRVSGDEPATLSRALTLARFSPRERG